MKRTALVFALALGVGVGGALIAFAQPASAPASAPVIDPRADALLKKMNAFVTQHKNLTFTVEQTELRTTPGEQTEMKNTWDISIRHPDHLSVLDVSTGTRSFNTYYDGRSITFFSIPEKKYIALKAENTIDDTVKKFQGQLQYYQFIDLVKNDIYKGLLSDTLSGELGDKTKIEGADTQELRFSQNRCNWSIWIETGEKPWPRKMTAELLSPDGKGKMSLTLLFSKWTVPAELPESAFVFQAPVGAQKIEPK